MENIPCRSTTVAPDVNKRNKRPFLPRICCLNANSLNKKIDELAAFMAVNKVHLAAVIESWFCDDIEDAQVSIGGCVVHRKDRMQCRGGDVCVYVSDQLPAKRCQDLEHPGLECMWLWIRPPRLPRPVSTIAVCVLYSPPDKSARKSKGICVNISWQPLTQ